MLKKLNYYLQLCRVAGHLFRGLYICFLLFPWLSNESKKKRIQRWSQQLLTIFNIHLKLNLNSTLLGTVIISNHVSWLDIFVINSLVPCQFVAKSDIRSWPVLGWLAKQAGTIFISRGSKSDVKRIYNYLINQIELGERVAFFPEGTVASQGDVLPFHANLFEAAIHAKVPVQPIALRYLNSTGNLHQAIEFAGDISFATSLINILSGGEVIVELHSLECVPSDGAHRRELASASREAVALALQVKYPSK